MPGTTAPVTHPFATPSGPQILSEKGEIVLAALLESVRSGRSSAPEHERAQWAAVEGELLVLVEELRQQYTEVDAALERLHGSPRLLVHGLAGPGAAVMRVDAHGVLTDADASARSMLGIPAPITDAKPLVAFVDLAYRRELRSAISRAAREHVASAVEVVVTPRHRLPERWMLALGPQENGDLLVVALPLDSAEGLVFSAHAAVALAALSALATISLAKAGLVPAVDEIAGLVLAALPLLAGVRIDWEDEDRHFVQAGLPMAGASGPPDAVFAEGTAIACGPAESRRRWVGLSAPAGSSVTGLVSVPVPLGDGIEVVVTVWSVDEEFEPGLTVQRLLLPFGKAVAALLADARLISQVTAARDQLQQALTSRAVIDQAKGMIMMATGCDETQAFARLVAMSSRNNRKLRDIAQEVVRDASGPKKAGHRS